jgi:heat shock protein HtpX
MPLLNHAKTAMLLAGLMGLFLLVGSFYGQTGLIVALVFGGVMNLGAWFFSDTIAIKSMQGREITPEATTMGGVNVARIYESVERLAGRAELPMPRVYLCPHDAPNAFATGRSPNKAAVAVTRGLAQLMNDEELDGVIAHELAHIKNRDTLISTIAATVAGTLAFIAQWFFLFGGGRREGSHPLLGFAVIILAAVGAAVIKAMISRTREFGADAEGARIAGSGRGLASALNKLDATARRVPLHSPNPAQHNLFIVEPLAGKSLTNLFATHPPVPKRVEALRQLHMSGALGDRLA